MGNVGTGTKRPVEGDRVIARGWEYSPMIDDNITVPPGTEGTVSHIDDVGTIHVKWDNGSTIGLIGADKWSYA